MTKPPSVDAVLRQLGSLQAPRALVIEEIHEVFERVRDGKIGLDAITDAVRSSLNALAQSSLQRVINATGVVLHTNLGRAPLPRITPEEGYSNLEYSLSSGKRDKRDHHYGELIERLLGCPGIAVNNNAAAIYLVLQELACGGEVIISRGELIEIGDGFRIPDIMGRSGATLREVGTTNKTSIEDYRAAINERTRLILRVHPSNFRVSGFTAKPALKEIAALGRSAQIPVYEDLGSGCLANLKAYGVDEPLVTESLDAGVDLVSFSCDKLLGGPQTGIIAGKPDLVQRIRQNPMYRAFRCDKLIVRALETILRKHLFEQYDEIPALWMIRRNSNEIKARAIDFVEGIDAEVIPGESVIGGGATPETAIPTWLIALNGTPREWEEHLRNSDPPVIARIHEDRVLLDLRTVFPEEEEQLRRAIQARAI